jgi:hypothetical protein
MTKKSPSSRARRWMRAGVALGAGLFSFVAMAGFLHTSAGRPLLQKLSGGGCPFGRDKLEPARREELRKLGLSKLAHRESQARARPALGFELGKPNRTEIVSWARERGVACKSESLGSGLACDAVPAELLGVSGEHDGSLTFRFDARERLVGLLYMVRTADAEGAVALGESEQARLRVRLGAPTRASGELSVASLERGILRQAREEHRYRDYSAFASVTNLGDQGYLVTEEAQLVD